MTQTPKKILIGFGIALFVAVLAAFIWSFTRPPVKDGPWPPTRTSAGAGRG